MKLILDSDFLFGLVVKNDPHHERCKVIFSRLRKTDAIFTALNLVIQETATVISKKRNHQESLEFLKLFRRLPIEILFATPDLENRSWEVFERQTKKGTSFIDCANLAALEEFKLDGILSFDEFYPKSVIIRGKFDN